MEGEGKMIAIMQRMSGAHDEMVTHIALSHLVKHDMDNG